ncbi:hypothetical protein [Clostridium tertium]|nr:hypothetical protein [Clostridium tertium]
MRKSKETTKKIIASTLVGTVIVSSALTNVVNAETTKISTSGIVNMENGDVEGIIESIRRKCKEDLIGGELIDVNNETIAKKIAGYVKQTKTYLESMNLDENNDYLWENLKDYKDNPARITSMFNNIVSMSMAYNLPNDTYYKNEKLKDNIIYALEWINKNAYNSE